MTGEFAIQQVLNLYIEGSGRSDRDQRLLTQAS
jgi:hypothetical protein